MQVCVHKLVFQKLLQVQRLEYSESANMKNFLRLQYMCIKNCTWSVHNSRELVTVAFPKQLIVTFEPGEQTTTKEGIHW